jgi:hypothetical protein
VRIATHLSGGTTIEGLSFIFVLWHCAFYRRNNCALSLLFAQFANF